MRKSYFVNLDGGVGRYFRTKRDAVKCFNTQCVADDPYESIGMPLALELHHLTDDCFERAYNGGGGFVEQVTTIKSREK